MGAVIGIDLGTTNSCVAFVDATGPVVIHNPQGLRTTPSMVAYRDDDVLVGVPAKRQAVTNPTGTLFGVKRLIGRKFDSAEVQDYAATLPFEVVAAHNGDAWMLVGGEPRSPQEICGELLGVLKGIAEGYIGETVTHAVVTVPAYFDERQRQATKDACFVAGLDVKRIINEPTAAALAYGMGKQRDQVLAVFDFGGGTFDISILEIDGTTIEVLACSGDNSLGGADIDRLLIDMLLHDFLEETGVDLSRDPTALQRLKQAAEEAKHELSVALTVEINLPFIGTKDNQPVHLSREIKRSALEILIEGVLERLVAPCLVALEDANMTAEDIDAVVLVGGMTRMPAVQQKVAEIFGKEPVRDVHPDEAVALGAALQAAALSGELERDMILMDVTAFSLGINVRGGRFSRIIHRNETIPCREKKLFAPVDDGQNFVTLQIYQGEGQLVKDNTYLGSVNLTGLTNTASGQARVEVTFTLDADGLLKVDAVDLHTSRAASVELQPSAGLTREQLDQLVAEGKARRR